MIVIHEDIVENSKDVIKNNGPYDMIFIDHEKSEYLSDLKKME